MDNHVHLLLKEGEELGTSIKRITVTSQQAVYFGNLAIHVFYIFSYQYATDRCSMTIQEFCGAVKNKINTILKRLLQVWCGKSIIYRKNTIICFSQYEWLDWQEFPGTAFLFFCRMPMPALLYQGP